MKMLMRKFALGIAILCLLAGCQNKNQEVTTVCVSQENQVIKTIMERRSIRKYKQQPVEREKMEQILRCGINAPNGQNKQSWEVRVVDNPNLLNAMKEAMVKGHPDMDPEMVKGCFRDAPVMVFIARDKSYDFSAYDCGLMAENMMLSAWSMGIGSICLGSPVRFLTDNDVCVPYVEKLGFTDGYELCLCVGFGYADEAPAAKPREWSKVKYVE
ncbi:MAG: nitroreductase family protein [Bacteroidales bacterium]|nr:nitroreductase family protein [Bacteroidales bacterium]